MVGIASKISGSNFEHLVEMSAKKSGWAILKIPEGCRRIGRNVVPIKSPFDYLAAKKSRAIFFDAKTIKSGNFTYSKINQRQVEKLILLEQTGHLAGYLIYLRDKKIIMFSKASQMKEMKKGEHVKDPCFYISTTDGRFDFNIFLNQE